MRNKRPQNEIKKRANQNMDPLPRLISDFFASLSRSLALYHLSLSCLLPKNFLLRRTDDVALGLGDPPPLLPADEALARLGSVGPESIRRDLFGFYRGVNSSALAGVACPEGILHQSTTFWTCVSTATIHFSHSLRLVLCNFQRHLRPP